MPAGIGGAGWLALTFETAVGTYLPPTTAGTIWIPIISESLHYVEEPYYSPQIRQKTAVSSRVQGYYHVEGDVVLEFDPNNFPYLMYGTRHTITKSGASDPWTYTYTPSTAGSTSTAASGAVPRTLSLTAVRNGVGFGYGGCIINTMEVTIDTGVLRMSLGVLGMNEQVPGGLGSPVWVDPALAGAAAHSVFVDAAGTAPAFATPSTDFNGFTANMNFNGAAQNRLSATRSASYVSYGESEVTYTTELDFVSRTEYDNFKNNTTRALKLESLENGANFAASTRCFQLILHNTAYDSYEVGLGGMGDLIMAAVTGRAMEINGGFVYTMKVKSPVNIA